ncbi:MAG: DNA mismatch repair endonuclease MutL [Oscillospiraceae bacterium]|nr:DNA mismatch repair endonuclease MutL [Oscillospiraceae bacterium]
MGKIHVLDKALAELIAAGEVVERPASIAKELIENSVDAGAKSITVEIEKGGVSLLRVCDDGCGIAREDIRTAFLRHATSKISSQKDLEGITSLGFRGEALASIAAMCRVELTSKAGDETEGTTCRVEGGEELAFIPAGCPTGTIITVRDVFYNTPARMKFLKKDVGEGNAVAQVVEKCAISHPEIAFRFVRDGKVRLQTSGGGKLMPVISLIYGRDMADSMISVAHGEPQEGVSVSGYVTDPSGARPGRTYQNFYLNGRFVKSKTAVAALEEAFKTVLGGGKYPGCAIFIEIVPSLVDVNVHPAKTEVRFANERPVFHCVYHAVKNALAATRNGTAPRPPAGTSRPYGAQPQSVMTAADYLAIFSPGEKTEPLFNRPLTLRASRPDIYVGADEAATKRSAVAPSPVCEDIPEDNRGIIMQVNAGKSALSATVITRRADRLEEPQQEDRFIGEYAGTYILLEREGNLVLVDKHAAHERLIYEKLKERIEYGDRQELLAPVTVTLSGEEHSALLENQQRLLDYGFVIDDFGGSSVAVREIPLELGERDIALILSDIAEKLIAGKQDITPDALDRLYFSIACKGALRARDKNTQPELMAIVDRLKDNPQVTHCPHGRPVQATITAAEVEKLFGRRK